MKPLVIKKEFGTEGEYIITHERGDNDTYCLEWHDTKLNAMLKIVGGGNTDGGSIPNIAKGAFDPLLDKTAHGFIFHDELWRHRVYYKELYEKLGMTFTETNRIMQDIHRAAGCSWLEIHLTRKAVRWFGWYKWRNPDARIKAVKEPTLIIEELK